MNNSYFKKLYDTYVLKQKLIIRKSTTTLGEKLGRASLAYRKARESSIEELSKTSFPFS